MASPPITDQDLRRMRTSSLLVAIFLTLAPLAAFLIAGNVSVRPGESATVFDTFDFADSRLAYVAFGGLAFVLTAGVWVARFILLRAIEKSVRGD